MKKHFEVLDGLRGTAALLVVIYHLMEVAHPNPLYHAHLAVDFFFLLSGYVVGYAYDNRLQTGAITIKDFFRIRLIRLHPLVILGTLLGALGYWLDPFAGYKQPVNGGMFLLAIILGALLLPAPSMPNRGDETHSLNGPSWSLLQEYLVNIVYAVFCSKLTIKVLWVIVVLSAIALGITAIEHGHLAAGWGWSSFWIAPVRVCYPFFMGLLLFKTGTKIKVPFAYPLLSLLILLNFAWPFNRYDGAVEFLSVLVPFPLIVAAGAGSTVSGFGASICRFFGKISYPIYIIHYPFVYLYTHWVYERHPSNNLVVGYGIGLIVFVILISWFLLKYFDEPVRAWLTQRYGKHQPKNIQQVNKF
jgi:peptidoglycan/LPS O-acetylase OafA/YrhL